MKRIVIPAKAGIRLEGVAVVLVVAMGLPGCSWAWKNKKMTELETQNEQLKGQLAEAEKSRASLLASLDKARGEMSRTQEDHAREVERLMAEREKAIRLAEKEKAREADQKIREIDELAEAQRQLAESLKKELGDARATLARTERGLVLTFLDEIFFDSGKAEVKPDGEGTLQKVAQVLQETVPDSPVAVEGHTDNEPIRYSGWKSNWELSAARALAVVHYFTGQQGVSPERLRAVGFGEYHPVAANDTPENMRQNRRVEVVILPKTLTKEKPAP